MDLRTHIVGIVGDVRRDMEGHHYAESCSVFGINQQELEGLQRSDNITVLVCITFRGLKCLMILSVFQVLIDWYFTAHHYYCSNSVRC